MTVYELYTIVTGSQEKVYAEDDMVRFASEKQYLGQHGRESFGKQ